MKHYLSFILYFSFITLPLYSQGVLLNDSFYSPALNSVRNVDIYFPEAYLQDEDARFPVVYYLHGYGGDQNSQQFIIHELNQLIDDGVVDPMIIVKPDGSAGPLQYWNPLTAMFTNSELLGNHEDAIALDLVEYVDFNFRTISNPWDRAILGFSMGGECGMRMAFNHPELFCAVASHSGALDYRYVLSTIDNMIAEVGGEPPFEFSPTSGPFNRMNFTRAAAFSPNLSELPFQVNYILHTNGNLITETWDIWKNFDPLNIITSMQFPYPPKIYFDVGESDELGFFPYNLSFADSLASLDVDYVFDSFPGFHSNHIQERFPISLTFIDSVFNLLNDYFEPGDINLDHTVNVMDIILILNTILAGNGEFLLNCDLNTDGAVDILDIVSLVNYILLS